MVLIKNNYKTKISIKRYLFILSLVFLLTTEKLLAGGIWPAPLIRASYDFNLGYTVSYGVAIMDCRGECGISGYIMYSHSRKIQKSGLVSDFSKKLNKPKTGSNLSFGLYGGIGVASFRIGVNRMFFKEKTNKLWGVEASTQMFLLNGVVGMMYDSESKNIKPNLRFGYGIF